MSIARQLLHLSLAFDKVGVHMVCTVNKNAEERLNYCGLMTRMCIFHENAGEHHRELSREPPFEIVDLCTSALDWHYQLLQKTWRIVPSKMTIWHKNKAVRYKEVETNGKGMKRDSRRSL